MYLLENIKKLCLTAVLRSQRSRNYCKLPPGAMIMNYASPSLLFY
jgi:hypothetical protein